MYTIYLSELSTYQYFLSILPINQYYLTIYVYYLPIWIIYLSILPINTTFESILATKYLHQMASAKMFYSHSPWRRRYDRRDNWFSWNQLLRVFSQLHFCASFCCEDGSTASSKNTCRKAHIESIRSWFHLGETFCREQSLTS